MALIKKYDLLGNKLLLFSLNLISLLLFILFLFLFTLLATRISGINAFSFSLSANDLIYLIPFLLTFFVILSIHELIHGLFSKLFNKEAIIKYGFKKGCLYATAPGARYSRSKFTWICLAPFILITLLLTLLFSFNLINLFSFILLASMHAAGCTGDFFFVLIPFKHPGKILIEDSHNILMIYSNK
ncbi:DUF3267 domain-containing protein [Marinilactibacillus psychrotolerans]|uniref:DUF3267 domain-containing protein n=1 Tax=Marinilactibacillus psychrotolerans TaxID=191770 RepID=UPI001C7D845F|nr:DUF3267 domain-containing protein [Marinilactibacillus psychrotolerans]